MSKTVRIATVKATGQRFLVQQLSLDTGRAHCWGHVTSFKGRSTKHTASKHFVLDTVEVTEAPMTEGLAAELFEQYIGALSTAGWVLSRTRGGNYKIHSRGAAV